MAKGLRDGRVTVRSFAADAVADPDLRPLLKRIRIVEDPAFTAARDNDALAPSDPARLGQSEIVVTMRDGQRHTARTGITRGHHLNPMSDAELEEKFRGIAELVCPPDRLDALIHALWSLDEAETTGTVLDHWADVRERR
jgi:2-methylcitrate dehydratase